MENIKFYIDFFGGGDAAKAWEKAQVCCAGIDRWREWVSAGNDPFAYVPPRGWEWLKKTAVSHPNATAEMLAKGVSDDDWEVRFDAVSHPNATAEVLKKGAADEHQIVREAAMCHHNFGK